MPIKLALVGALGQVVGPWINVLGNEREIRVYPEYGNWDVRVECDKIDSTSDTITLRSSHTDFPYGVRRYRVHKHDSGPDAVSVKIFFN